ncbi:hypothetical protein CK203_101423 [Vitis vinifera]|uniref:Uncharacterized protein n=1 Tax=Vitis vinifera TaxID=29760 RepID=A0A438FHP0_VITVI|nr:hypothetical protein CK203_101423 [Vitis vinifera]
MRIHCNALIEIPLLVTTIVAREFCHQHWHRLWEPFFFSVNPIPSNCKDDFTLKESLFRQSTISGCKTPVTTREFHFPERRVQPSGRMKHGLVKPRCTLAMSDEAKVQALLKSRPSNNVRKYPKYLTQRARLGPQTPCKNRPHTAISRDAHSEPSSSPTLQGHVACPLMTQW